MKRGTIEHPKMLLLEAALRISKIEAIGLMEALWHWTARYAPRGDIGKYTDEQIAEGVYWPRKDCARLIQALVEKGWIDRHDEFRLVVHGWSEHAESSVRKYLDKQGLMFCNGDTPFKPRASRGDTLGIPDGSGGDDSGTPRARVPSPSSVPSSSPEPGGYSGDEAHRILISEVNLSAISYEQDLKARRAAGVDIADPRLVEWARIAVVQAGSYTDLDDAGKWWQAMLEIASGRRPARDGHPFLIQKAVTHGTSLAALGPSRDQM